MNNIRELRKNKNLTMKELGAILGVSESTISLYETGKRQPDYDILCNIADYFDTSVDYLLGRTDDISGEKNKPHAENGAELTDAKAEAWQLIQDMDDDTIRKLVTIAKTALLP